MIDLDNRQGPICAWKATLNRRVRLVGGFAPLALSHHLFTSKQLQTVAYSVVMRGLKAGIQATLAYFVTHLLL
ncbi:hypothetical protein D3C71_2117490 [compost metagenome]